MFSAFNPEELLQSQKQEPHHHPWEGIIKDEYANKIKTAHNSAHNPHYPKKKEKWNDKSIKRVKFTIIGNRVTEEFIYCINLVKGLHKYRPQHFESPVIRGVTGVDWPTVWNDIKIQYGGISYCLQSQVVVFLNDKIIGGEKELKELIEQEYTYNLSLNYYQESIKQFSNFIKGSGRPTVYMHISIDDEHIGTMIFMLYSDVVPFTCNNFLRLCNAKRGGYSGTPVHRIVKDGWIQCGGFGLKSTDLDCENFIVPHDKRGVLCMANAGRHVDCSTQFFVLLQPSPWMIHKYVAFGQLIDGDSTLRHIENVETWYEAPTKNITIYKAGILNLECEDIMINKSATKYIHGHIEDLFALEEWLTEALLTRVFQEIQLREDINKEIADPVGDIHATKRFMKKRLSVESPSARQSKSQRPKHESKSQTAKEEEAADEENNDFDVSEYNYEGEHHEFHDDYARLSIKMSEHSLVVKPEKPYYIPMTDVPYPGEVTSEYNLTKFLRGNYCLDTDLVTNKPEDAACIHKPTVYPVSFFNSASMSSSLDSSEESIDSYVEDEIQDFLNKHGDSTSFAGNIVRGISKGKDARPLSKCVKPILTDDDVRRIRLVKWMESEKDRKMRKVSLYLPRGQRQSKPIQRRQTGFWLPRNIARRGSSLLSIDTTRSLTPSQRKARIDPSIMQAPVPKIERRQTTYARPGAVDSDSEMDFGPRQSCAVSGSLFQRIVSERPPGDLPTLKNYRSPSDQAEKAMMLTCSHKLDTVSTDSGGHYRDIEAAISRKSLCSPRKTVKYSLRSIQYAKMRPFITVEEYHAKNLKYAKEMKETADENQRSTNLEN